MAQKVQIPTDVTLDRYEAVAHLASLVRELRAEGQQAVRAMQGRTLWMVNSTPQGGGVAEMLPTMVALLRDLGISTEWAVIESEDERFFTLTKQLHNLIHGEGKLQLPEGARETFERNNRENAQEMQQWLKPGDVLAVHDPQPMPLAGMLRSEIPDLLTLWRAHIGLDSDNAQTEAAWDFLSKYGSDYQHGVFSASEYIPDFFLKRSSIIHPAIDPLTHKNRDLNLHKTVGILSNAALTPDPGPLLMPPYKHVATRLMPDGSFVPANMGENIGLLTRPIITQISRWDRLKGFVELMKAFAWMKERVRRDRNAFSALDRRRFSLTRLVLGGPDPSSVSDDPEGQEVLEELISFYQSLDDGIQRDIALIAFPMESRKENALMVNAVQRASTIVVQNSIREGFGLTVTEAMWKHTAVLSNMQACGPRQQIRDGVDGRMINSPENIEQLGLTLIDMLQRPEDRGVWGMNAQRRVHQDFLIFSQLRKWLKLLNEQLEMR